MTASILAAVQLFFALVIGMYFWNLLRTQNQSRHAIERESKKELEKLRRMRAISLTEPLAERTRPQRIDDIIGQQDGVRALRAALCGPNPQHVIIYGPPGVGKTAAARLILEEAKRTPGSPFKPDAKFIELDATTARFDERGIADPLIGSVHDPIYQGAGAMGIAGIPQPKQGAVTKAHGGVLFIDEIGELHPIQMNKLLKVLEDRKVFLESAYYSSEDTNIPVHIHDIFQNGLPADFRLVGATTRSPEELPPALRSRCVEIFFRALTREEIRQVAEGAADKLGMPLEEGVADTVADYATNGRDAVNLVQMAGSLAMLEKRASIRREDIEWVVEFSRLTPRPDRKVADKPQVGVVNGLAVYGPQLGMLLEIEVTATPAPGGDGRLIITGLVEEETIGGRDRSIRRKSMAKSSLENVLTTLERLYGIRASDYHLHVNFPGGVPVDGPSAGVAMAVAIYSAVRMEPVLHTVAMTGELSILGLVRPVGGVTAKIAAAAEAGAKVVLIPKANWQESFRHRADIQVVPVERLEDVLRLSLVGGLDGHGVRPDVAAAMMQKPLAQ
ncbi:ATP-dependent protease LonB [Alicyclobacillus acidocaldarius]|uniref:endopeptidase La n=1 Tax=Alicyclobacillus acidocaldarius subsp. acidocaldarius (strain ATCC 27009 / DSM 446 / BCRC 14685 / JCM 5260 / KCTC 1825 / NBRC 15652 / NCIMB 11725 / NRRL B-14509 / 104-IA) TaxID=521098 RepID=C8WXN4_ALIAD|nr:ATP-dependent protease LonB [Alicyclobacillus acidocaldarius]ACV58855.1 Sigma 54 interacting domain protein [Alicyclobacillus acidocaldarius subsp. acidocaldarius DSM 446]